MRKCRYCGKEELCGIGKENIPVCEKHFKDYFKGKRLEIDKALKALHYIPLETLTRGFMVLRKKV